MKALLIASLLGIASLQAAHTQDAAALLQAADTFRMSAENLQIDTQIKVFNADGTPDKERRYTVFAQTGRRSLVLMHSPAERGQKVLMLGDDFWLLMPSSQRPLRITPMQKLLGDASTGDVATLSWSTDYTPTLVGEEPCLRGDAAEAAPPCLRLSLAAQVKGVTYQRIELWIGKIHHEPVRADLYVLSDKLAKQATFVMDKAVAPTMVTAMVLNDQVSNHKATQVLYLSRKARQVPAEWFHPMFLARNPPLE